MLTVSAAAACTTVRQPVSGEVLSAGDVRTFDHVVVITKDGVEHEARDVRVANDSVSGIGVPDGQRAAWSLAQVSGIEVLDREAAPAVKAVGQFALDVVVGAVQLAGSFARCLILRC